MPNKRNGNGNGNGSAEDLINRIGKILLSKQETIGVAESVTSGFVQAAFSQAENARKFFEGGITTYSISQKTKHLNVDPVHALASNCVSEIVACEMSMNVVKLFMTDWGIGIVGYAAPVPEKSVHELYAFYSIHHKEKEVASGRIDVENNTPSEVQKIFTTRLLEEFYKVIRK